MAEDSESESPSVPTDDDPSEPPSTSESADRDDDPDADIDPETDTVYTPDDAPEAGGSIEDFLDDDETIAADELAPAGATGSDDPYDRDERRSVSDAVGAPVPDDELEDDPDLELAAAVEDGDAESADTDTDDTDGGSADTDVDTDTSTGSTTPISETVPDHIDLSDGSTTTDDTDDGDTADAPAAGPTAQSPPADPTAMDDVEDGVLGEGPASDEEMPLADHIEEMIRRLAVVLVVGGVVTLAVFPVADQLINFLWNSHIPGAETITDRRPRLYGPLELLVTELKVAALAGFVVGLPIAVYETYLFMRPGLFPRERRYYLAAVPTSLVLALIGVAFSHFVVLPAIFAYFTSYTTGTAVVAFGLKETFGLILVLMGYMALVFQIPLFIMLAIMMNLTTREWLEGRRLLFWGGFLGLAFLVSPDPTGMAPIIVAATMITLFEGTLALLRWTDN
ncbi:twin-arginine translocase subunit TatC [Haloplanus salilacus]|uniref:twin-arginine translocase subunit TatC n=1 Tax=Haloplanus salilacus TaxID=2949994 RepID=UPI0030CEDC88